MGINGLLPLLKSIQKSTHLRKFADKTLGVDAYGWLHRGVVSCAIDLALDRPTSKYVDYAMHRVRMLIHFGVTPYIVFDGDYLPSKAITENERAKRRAESKRLGLELLKLDRPAQAQQELQRAVDVTPEMARQLIEELKKINVKYVVAPYEADAQLAYLEKKGIIQGIISEDSDLLVFGAKCLLTKLDQYGECTEISRRDFGACREVSLIGWTDVQFRMMAILSGCDYLTNIPKMGPKSAYRFVRKYKDIEKIVKMVQYEGKMTAPQGYLENFRKAELTFLHQRVFCPVEEKLVMINDLAPHETVPENLSFIGDDMDVAIAQGVARGDLDPMTKCPIILRHKQPALSEIGRTSTGRTVTATPLEEKVGKPIREFFKPKRTPLAELDPNCFTPSPSQRRLLDQGPRTWLATPATNENQDQRAPHSAPVHATRPFSTITPSTSTNARSFATVAHQPKRQRLCEEPLSPKKYQDVAVATGSKSKFFGVQESPSVKRVEQQVKQIAKALPRDPWSDDAIEGVMAELPDIQSGPGSRPGRGLFVLSETQQCSASSASVPSLISMESDVIETSLSSLESCSTSQCLSKSINARVTSDFQRLAEKYTYGSTSLRTETSTHSDFAKSSRNARFPVDVAQPITSDDQLYLASSPTSHVKHPEPPKNTASVCSFSKTTRAILGCVGDSEATIEKIPESPKQSQTPALKGSEDYMIPDSDDEEESVSPTALGPEPARTLGLNRFVYTG